MGRASIAGAEVGGPAARKRLRDELAWAGYGRVRAGDLPATGAAATARPSASRESLRMADAVTAFDARDTAKSPLSRPSRRAQPTFGS